MREAYVNGFSPCDKGNKEIAIAFRPDFFVDYVRDLDTLHDFGQSTEDLSMLNEIAQHPEINDEDIRIQDVGRRTTIVTVSKRLRATNFKKRVLTAYSYHCATCGIQLKLVEAAHIIPVNHGSSTDETRNGIALCALHHKAFDQALITVGEDYSVKLNQSLVTEIKKMKLDDGLANFAQSLRTIIILPPAVSDRPHTEFIKLANQIRGWK